MSVRDEVDALAHEFFKDRAKTNTWMISANPMLGGWSPIEMINSGRGQWLLRWMEERFIENEEEDVSEG